MTTLLADSTAYASVTTSWDLPSGAWTKLRLIRNAAGTPRDERDGDVLFEDNFATARTSYLDTELTTGRYYYYALFTLTGTEWTRVGDSLFLVSKDWGYTGKLYNALPEALKSSNYTNVADTNQDVEESFLYKFLSVFGFQLDALRTDAESLKFILDATLANQVMLPALAAQVGVPYEPEIGTRALRGLIANAIHLWGLKGTVPGVRELASVLTGYVTHVRIGKNLVLDNLGAGPSTDIGRWRGVTNCTVTYRANAITDANPAGEGVRIIKATAAGTTMAAPYIAAGDTALKRRQWAIPVLPSTDYVISQYARTPGTASTVATIANWLDADGNWVGGTVTGANSTLNGSWVRTSLHAASPSTARYVIIGMITGALAADQTVEHCGVQVEEGTAPTAWQCARKILIYFDPQLINYVGNTSGADGTSTGWSTGVQPVSDATYGFYLVKFVPDPPNPNDVYPINALEVVVPGDTVPPDPPPEDSLALTENWYPAAHQAVTPGQTWTVLAEAIPPIGDDGTTARYGRVGFRLYNGSTLVGHSMGPEELLHINTWTPLSHELVVPDGATYDHIEFCIITEGLCGFRHAALENVNEDGAFYFDGSSPSATGDYLWMGTPFRDPTASYDRRSSRTIRLRALLNDYLPYGSCYDIVFAASAIPPTPQSISGVNPDPATSLPL